MRRGIVSLVFLGGLALLPFSLSATDLHPAKTALLANSEYAPALLQGISDARKSIICAYYLFKLGDRGGNLPRRIAEELVRAHQRGVEVTVVLEKQGKKKDRLDADNRATALFLTRNGVKVFFDSPTVTTHTKVTVIDARYVYLGSHNLTQGALRYNNELSVLIDSPEMAAEIHKYIGRL